MKNNYYITGGAGFIGRHLNKIIKDNQVINIDLRKNNVVKNQIAGDINNIEDIRRSIGNSDIIVHLAASHYDFEKDYFKTNVGGTRNLLQVATEKDIRQFVFFSSVAVYGTTHKPTSESVSPKPDNDYGRSKLEAENLIQQWATEMPGRLVLIIRPAVVFGPHNYGNLFNLTRQIDKGKNFHIGHTPVVKSIVFVRNLVMATKFLIENPLNEVNIYNYVDEPQLTNKEISTVISETLGKHKPKTIPLFLALLAGNFFDVISFITKREMTISANRIKKYCTASHFLPNNINLTNFKPQFNTIEGLVETTKWYNENRDEWNSEYAFLKNLFQSYYGITLE